MPLMQTRQANGNRKSNLLFAKASSSICGPYDDIVRPSVVELLDYEVEFALVLRGHLSENSQVTEANIADFVAGVVLCNDVSRAGYPVVASHCSNGFGQELPDILPDRPGPLPARQERISLGPQEFGD